MAQLEIKGRTITEEDCFIIAEIGSNHMGNLDLCIQMIREAADCGVDAVKLQKRDNKAMFTEEAYDQPYDNEYSYADTYGEHREALDWFGVPEYQTLIRVADEMGVILFATPFEENSADFLSDLDMPLYKIASCDVTNRPLLRYVAAFGKPMILSTGGATLTEITEMVMTVALLNKNFAIMHCISTYPNEDNELNLKFILHLKTLSEIVAITDPLLGFSSHHPGLLPHYIARTQGASIFEAHFTLNRGSRGTDHGFSLEPEGLRKLCQDLPRIKPMLGQWDKSIAQMEKDFRQKMGKSIYLKRDMKAGTQIQAGDTETKAPADGLTPFDNVLGRILTIDVSTNHALREVYFK